MRRPEFSPAMRAEGCRWNVKNVRWSRLFAAKLPGLLRWRPVNASLAKCPRRFQLGRHSFAFDSLVKTLERIFCERHRCDKWEFRRTVFRETLYPHAIPVASLVRGEKRRIFAPDFLLIEYVSRAIDLRMVADEVKEFSVAEENRRWLRRIGRMRISGARILRFASEYLPGEDAPADARGCRGT